MSSENFFVRIDYNLFKEAVELIIKKLIKFSSLIDIKIDKKKKKVIIGYQCDKDIQMNKKDLIQCLQNKEFESKEFFFQLALEILDILKVKTKTSKGQIIMNFQ